MSYQIVTRDLKSFHKRRNFVIPIRVPSEKAWREYFADAEQKFAGISGVIGLMASLSKSKLFVPTLNYARANSTVQIQKYLNCREKSANKDPHLTKPTSINIMSELSYCESRSKYVHCETHA